MEFLTFIFGLILIIIFIAFLLGLYFVPWLLAGGKSQSASVFIINFFLGWTFIGWVIALAMAVAPDKGSEQK